MSNIEANTTSADTNPEQSFSIQPHPAKTNDPADLQLAGGLRDGGLNVFQTPGPFIPNEEILKNLPEPLSREELQVKQAALKN